MAQFTKGKLNDFGNTGQIMPLLDRPQGFHGLSNFERAQINENARIAAKAKQNANNAKTREFGKRIMRLAQSKHVPLMPPPLPTKKRPLVPRSPVSNSSVPTSPVSNSSVSNYPVSNYPVSNYPVSNSPVSNSPVSNSSVSNYPVSNSPIPPVPKRSLPKITNNQEKKWENYTRTHPSVMLGMTEPTRPLPPLPVEGARRKTRRTRKHKTQRKTRNRK
jgi:hypothetical protein